MAHMFRFYVPPETPGILEVQLPESEAHHALHVARLSAGDSVVLFDGRGREMDGEVKRTTRHDVFVAVQQMRQVPAPARRLTIAQAWLHRDKSVEALIQHGTELGVSRFVFFRGGHSERAPKFSDKWPRAAIETCKQCGRLWLPEFEVMDDLESVLDAASGAVLIATKNAAPVAVREAVRGDDAWLVVGPEGDFTDAELRGALARGARPISLGDATYRAEVAAGLAAALILYELGELGPVGGAPSGQ